MNNSKKIFFEHQAALSSGLKSLNLYRRVLRYNLDNSVVDDKLIMRFFEANDGTVEEKQIEKLIKLAVIQCVFDNPKIEEENKKQIAQTASKEFVEILHGAKIDYEYASGKFGSGMDAESEREKRQKEWPLVEKAVTIEKGKKFIIKHAVKKGVNLLIKAVIPVSGIVATAIRKISHKAYELLPATVKEPINNLGQKLEENVTNVIHNAVDKIKETHPKTVKVFDFVTNVFEAVGTVSSWLSKVKGKVKGKAKEKARNLAFN